MTLELVPPYPPRCNANVDKAREHARAWARRMGLVDSTDPRFAIWDQRDFDDFDLPLFASYVHPDAPADRLQLLADWYVWGWYLDDFMLERYKRTGDVAGARTFAARLAESAGAPRDPVARGYADLLSRTPQQYWQRLAASAPEMLAGALWEVENLARHRIPDPVDYLQTRRLAAGVLWAIRLAEYALDLPTPTHNNDVQRLYDAFSDVVDLHNDLVSYRRETEYEHEVSNGVVVSQAFLGTWPDAVVRVRQLLQARLETFERLTSSVPEPYAQALRDWIAGDYQWHLETARYRESSWRRKIPVSHTPSGFGMSGFVVPGAARATTMGG